MNKNKITHWATINPELLKWAREKSALSFSEIISKTNIESESLEEWENGISLPTFRELMTLADFYNRPISFFYLFNPPELPLFERDIKAKKAFEYLLSVGFTIDHWKDALSHSKASMEEDKEDLL